MLLMDSRHLQRSCRDLVVSCGVVPPLLLLIPSPEANEKYTRHFPCSSTAAITGRPWCPEWSTKTRWERTAASVYPYPINERQEVLDHQRFPVRHRGRSELQLQSMEQLGTKDYENTRGIPDPSALRKYVQQDEPRRLVCTGGTAGKSVQYWISDFIDGVTVTD